MLMKLLKYEFRATARSFAGGYLAIVLSALLFGLTFQKPAWNAESGLNAQVVFMLVYIAALMAVAVLTIITVVSRFHKNLLGGEGYLMNTLPVRPSALIASKAIAATVWCMASCFVAAFSMFLMIAEMGVLDGASRPVTWISEVLLSGFDGVSAVLCLVLSILLWVSSMLAAVLSIYTALMVGSLKKQWASPIAVVAFFAMQLVQGKVTELVSSLFVRNPSSNLIDLMYVDSGYWLSSLVMLAVTVVFAAVWFLTADWLMTNRLNLE